MIEDICAYAAIAITFLTLVACLAPNSSPPPKELYMSPRFQKPPCPTGSKIDTLNRMAVAMGRHIHARGECTSADLSADGFTEAQILAYANDARAIVVTTGRAPARDPAHAVA